MDIVDNLIADIIWLIVGLVVARILYLVSSVAPHKRLWQLADPHGLVISAAHTTTTDTTEYMRPNTGIGEMRALALTARSLNKAYGKLDIRNILLSSEPLQGRLENDLLLLGGPKHNQVTARFLDLIKEKQPFSQVGSTIMWRGVPTEAASAAEAIIFAGETDDKKNVVKDYGLIIRCRSPFTSRQSRVILISGCHTYGVVAAAKYFTEEVPRIGRSLFRKRNIAFLVWVDVVDGYPGQIRLERSFKW